MAKTYSNKYYETWDNIKHALNPYIKVIDNAVEEQSLQGLSVITINDEDVIKCKSDDKVPYDLRTKASLKKYYEKQGFKVDILYVFIIPKNSILNKLADISDNDIDFAHILGTYDARLDMIKFKDSKSRKFDDDLMYLIRENNAEYGKDYCIMNPLNISW